VHRLKICYKKSLLGWAWALLQPLSLMLIYTIIFSVVTRIPMGRVLYVLFALLAVSHSQLITKVFFPRGILPLSYVIAGFTDFILAMVLLACMLINRRVAISSTALYVMPTMVIVISAIEEENLERIDWQQRWAMSQVNTRKKVRGLFYHPLEWRCAFNGGAFTNASECT
jgi:ABC-type polysaccharide/polyol phosphate export permease